MTGFRGNRDPPATAARASDVVSIRAEAWDVAGNRVEQTITGAYRLADRTGGGPARPG